MKKVLPVLFLIYLVSIIILLIIPTSGSGINLNFKIFNTIRSDHFIHTLLFIPFMIFCRLIFQREKFLNYLLLGILFCAFCEILHYFIPYREFSIYDFYANLTGLFIGSSAFLFKRV